MSDENNPRPPGPKIQFSNDRLHEFFLEAGTRRVHKLCPKCLSEADFNHRVGFLFCKARCVLCDKFAHLGKVCPLMQSVYASFFTRTWWSDHCDLGGDCPWENDALEHLLAADATFNSNQNASSASRTNRGPRGNARPHAPSGQFRNDRNSRSRSPSRHGSNYNGRSNDRNGRSRTPSRHGRSNYRADRFRDNRCDNSGNHSRGNANTYRHAGPAGPAPPRQAPRELPRQPPQEGAPLRTPAHDAIFQERMRLKGEMRQQQEPAPEQMDLESHRDSAVHNQAQEIAQLQQLLASIRAEMQQQIQQQVQQQVAQQMLSFQQQWIANMSAPPVPQLSGFSPAPPPFFPQPSGFFSGPPHFVPQSSGLFPPPGSQNRDPISSQQSTRHVPDASGGTQTPMGTYNHAPAVGGHEVNSNVGQDFEVEAEAGDYKYTTLLNDESDMFETKVKTEDDH